MASLKEKLTTVFNALRLMARAVAKASNDKISRLYLPLCTFPLLLIMQKDVETLIHVSSDAWARGNEEKKSEKVGAEAATRCEIDALLMVAIRLSQHNTCSLEAAAAVSKEADKKHFIAMKMAELIEALEMPVFISQLHSSVGTRF